VVKITLFGLAGTGTSTIGKMIASTCGYDFFSGGLMFRDMAKQKNMDLYEFSELCAKDKKYDIELDKKIKQYGIDNDNFVFESRICWYFIPDSIKIKLSCDDNIRFERISKRDQKDLGYVITKTKERELSERDRYMRYYGLEDYDSNLHFDIVVDTSYKTEDEILRILVRFIESYQKKRSRI